MQMRAEPLGLEPAGRADSAGGWQNRDGRFAAAGRLKIALKMALKNGLESRLKSHLGDQLK